MRRNDLFRSIRVICHLAVLCATVGSVAANGRFALHLSHERLGPGALAGKTQRLSRTRTVANEEKLVDIVRYDAATGERSVKVPAEN